MKNVYDITNEFEKRLAEYTGTPYVVTVDNQSNALFLALMYEKVKGQEITIPSRTYPSVPCEIIHAGAKVKFKPGTHMCVSFTGPYKHFKLSKGGAILTDSEDAYFWFKRARYSGRRECSYHEDHFDMLGWNFYMMPELAARGLLLMNQFYDSAGKPKTNPDLELSYPDLSKFEIYNKANRECE